MMIANYYLEQRALQQCRVGWTTRRSKITVGRGERFYSPEIRLARYDDTLWTADGPADDMISSRISPAYVRYSWVRFSTRIGG